MQADGSIDRATLDARLRAAAKAGDARELALGYRLAADLETDALAIGFFSTHAYVWALVAGEHELAERLAEALRRSGRLD